MAGNDQMIEQTHPDRGHDTGHLVGRSYVFDARSRIAGWVIVEEQQSRRSQLNGPANYMAEAYIDTAGPPAGNNFLCNETILVIDEDRMKLFDRPSTELEYQVSLQGGIRTIDTRAGYRRMETSFDQSSGCCDENAYFPVFTACGNDLLIRCRKRPIERAKDIHEPVSCALRSRSCERL